MHVTWLRCFLVCFFLTSIVSLHTNCTNNSNTGGENTNADGGAVDRSTFRRCELGNAINECTGEGDCKAQRDCDPIKGYDRGGVCYEGVCVEKPKLADSKTEKGAPDFSCLDNPPALPAGPDKATWWGPVEAFGLDGDTTGLKVEIFDQEAFHKDPNTSPLGTYTSDVPKSEEGCANPCGDGAICLKKSCQKTEDSKGYQIGYFEIKDLPSNKLLVVRVTGPGFVPTIQYNLWITASDIKDGFYRDRAFVISEVTKSLIPATAGISRIAPGNSAVAGELQDCKGNPLQGAIISVSSRPQKLAYFNGEGDQPDPEQNETNRDGTYAALNIKPPSDGIIEVRAIANVGGTAKKLIKYSTRLFPDSITILTMPPWHPGLAASTP